MVVEIEDGTSDDDPKILAQVMKRSEWPEWEKAMEEGLVLAAKYDVWDVVDEPGDTNIVGSSVTNETRTGKSSSTVLILLSRVSLRRIESTSMTHSLPSHDYPLSAQLSHLPLPKFWNCIRWTSSRRTSTVPSTPPFTCAYPLDTTRNGRWPVLNNVSTDCVRAATCGTRPSLVFNELALTRSVVDHGVFYSHDDDGSTIVCSSTDGFAIAATPPEHMSKFKADLGNHFEMSDLHELAWIIGIRAKRDRSSRAISLSQTAYIDSLVKRFQLVDAPPLSTLFDPNALLLKDQSPSTLRQFDDTSNVPYREAIGSLMYATVGTRPDITFAVTALS